MSDPILLDEMLSATIAGQLRAKGHDVIAVVEDPALISLPDDQILACAAAAGRALVTANPASSSLGTSSSSPAPERGKTHAPITGDGPGRRHRSPFGR